jgi:hypothetical protein
MLPLAFRLEGRWLELADRSFSCCCRLEAEGDRDGGVTVVDATFPTNTPEAEKLILFLALTGALSWPEAFSAALVLRRCALVCSEGMTK